MKVIFWGAGNAFLEFLKEEKEIFNQLDVVGVVDSNPQKQGTKIGEFNISAPETINTWGCYDKIVISTVYYSDQYFEIYDNLITTFKIPENKITALNNLIIPSTCNVGSLRIMDSVESVCCMEDLIRQKRVVPNNDLEKFFFYNQHRIITKWWHYFEIYDLFFQKYRNKKINFLEIGVFKGGSLQLWRDYFGRNCSIVGIDINPECMQFEEEGIHVCIGSQDNQKFLNQVLEKYGPFDIVLDDGSHIAEHQIISFETLFAGVKDNGLYIVEDTHTAYWEEFGGGFRNNNFIEYSKNIIDGLHNQYIDKMNKEQLPVYSIDIKACHFYDSMCIFEKKKRGKSVMSMEGRR